MRLIGISYLFTTLLLRFIESKNNQNRYVQLNLLTTMLGIAQLINEGWAYESNVKDYDVSLRVYKTAYNNIFDINTQIGSTSVGIIPTISPFEVRSVADYINHRICHIQFRLSHPREAITQFKKHIDTFKQHTKSPEYSFEHAAWLSQQYLLFADLFSEAITEGVKASKAQHPGLYYYEAGMQMIARRQNITEYTNDYIRSNQMPVTREFLTMINSANFASFLRQCGWTCVEINEAPPVGPSVNKQTLPKEREPINYSVSKTVVRIFDNSCLNAKI